MTQNILLLLLTFLGLGAIGGGGVLIISPSGKLIGMPLKILAHSPFNSFLIPGIILFVVLGVFPILLVVALVNKTKSKFAEKFNCFTDMHWSRAYSIYVAFTLIIWIQLEMVFLNTIHWLHTFYMFYAVAIIFVSLLPSDKNLYKDV